MLVPIIYVYYIDKKDVYMGVVKPENDVFLDVTTMSMDLNEFEKFLVCDMKKKGGKLIKVTKTEYYKFIGA